MAVNLFHVGNFRNETTIKFGFFFLLENCFRVRINDKGNIELVLSTMESHKKNSLRACLSSLLRCLCNI